MARLARVVVPGLPYHVTHRGNRRGAVFFSPEDRVVYLALLKEWSERRGLEVWAFCLMTNHIHLIVCPAEPDSLSRAVGKAHAEYARWVNREQGWSGHLWADRFYSSALDGEHLWDAVRYVEANPVRARMTRCAAEYPWSSCLNHSGREPDSAGILSPGRPFPGWVGAAEWVTWVNAGTPGETILRLRENTASGRPTGSREFVRELETLLGRELEKPPMGRREQAKRSQPKPMIYSGRTKFLLLRKFPELGRWRSHFHGFRVPETDMTTVPTSLSLLLN